MRLTAVLCAALAFAGLAWADQAPADAELAAFGNDPAAAARAVQAAMASSAVAAKPELPAARPPLWPFRAYKDAASWSCAINGNGVLYLRVAHKEVPGVTAAMMKWLYNGGMQGVTTHPATGAKVSNYLLLHPRDHSEGVGFSRLPLKVKDTNMTVNDYILVGCSATSDAAAPYACPAGGSNPGFTSRTATAAMADAERVNSTVKLIGLKPASVVFGVRGCNSRGQCANVVKSRTEWSDTPAGVRVSTTQEFGLDMGLARANINPRVLHGWAGAADPVKKCQRMVLHYIEEIGALQHWLPQAYTEAAPAPQAPAPAPGRKPKTHKVKN